MDDLDLGPLDLVVSDGDGVAGGMWIAGADEQRAALCGDGGAVATRVGARDPMDSREAREG